VRTKSFIIICVAILFFSALHGQTAHRHVLDDRIDSLQRIISKAPPDSSKVDLYLELANNYIERFWLHGNPSADSLACFQSLAICQSLSQKLHYVYGEGTCLLRAAKMYWSLKNLPACAERLQQAFILFRDAHHEKGLAYYYICKSTFYTAADQPTKIKFCDTALQLAIRCRDPKMEAKALIFRAQLHSGQREFLTAIQDLSRALDLQKRSGDNTSNLTKLKLAFYYRENGKFKEALEYAIAALDESQKQNDTAYVYRMYTILGFLYVSMGNLSDGYIYYNKALSALANSNYQQRTNVLTILTAITEILRAFGKPQEALDFFSRELKKYPPVDSHSKWRANRTFLSLYFYVKNFKEAEKYLLKIINYNIEKESMFTVAATVYYELKQYDKAARYADTAYALAKQAGYISELSENCLTLYKLAIVKGNYKTALRYFEEHKNHSDSIQRKVFDNRAIELSVKYETDQKNSQLQFLTTQTKLNEVTIKQGVTQRNFMIAGSVLLLLLLLLIFNRYRVKQKANKLLQEKQDEINWQNQQLEKMVAEEKMITAEKDKLLQEKEWLMKEINHRVKNNLQVVMSLLNTQSAYLQDEAALNAIQESRHRVHAISLIHRKLYQSDQQLTTIDMANYIEDVTEYLADSLDTQHHIQFGLFIDPIELDVTQAVPTGLIINEAVTNAAKYAFPEDRKGQINISMHKNVNGAIELTIQDNGIGLPPDFDWQQSESLGMSLMQGLCSQLDGQFNLIQHNGITIKITFEPAKSLKQ
jgi:two-component system, sensor histidine kinase PdtaS